MRKHILGILGLVALSAGIADFVLKSAPSTPETKDSPSLTASVQQQAPAKPQALLPASPQPQSPASPTDIASKILSKNIPAQERREVLYQLTQTHSEEATRSLIKIAASDVDARDESSRFDVSLRITALEALDQRMASGEASASAITTVLKKQTHPTLLFFARISLEGVTSGRPGKLTRFIDQAFSEAGAG
ncbi:MAG: hypothetical protein ACJ763_13705 [Bdellovibrionia bacterium]